MAMSSAAITHLGILDIGGTALGICNIYEEICSIYDSFCSKNNSIFLKYDLIILIKNWICYTNDFTGSITYIDDTFFFFSVEPKSRMFYKKKNARSKADLISNLDAEQLGAFSE